MKAKVSEIFSSIQGEGLYSGFKQIFIRFFGCNLQCSFCDESRKLQHYQIFDSFGLLREVEKLNESFGPYHSLSLTGGEPLRQTEFLKEFLPRIKKIKIYLETNGTLPEKFNRISSYIDFISLDFKLPSSNGLKNQWSRHRKFLKLARNKAVFVKIVITGETIQDDLKKAIKIIGDTDKKIPLVLQPVSPIEHFKKLPSRTKLLDFQQLALGVLSEVRIIPQLHKIIGLQ